jgi:predicted PurR-regulated permease PerM
MFEDAGPTLNRFGLPETRRGFIEQYVEPRREEIAGIVQNFFNGFLGILGGAASKLFLLLFIPLFVFMILLDLEQFRSRWTSWVPPSLRSETVSIVTDIGDVFKKYLRGVLNVVLLYTVVMSTVLWLLGMPYFILLALIAGALYLVPLLGPLMSGITIFVVTGFSGLTGNWFIATESSWMFALILTATFFVVSTVFDQLLYPRLVGKAVDLHPLVSMFVVFSGGALFGLPGMLIAFPLAGSIKVVLVRLMRMTTRPMFDGLALPAVPLRHR